MNNRLATLLNLYKEYYPKFLNLEVSIKALKKFPEEMVLKAPSKAELMMGETKAITVAGRTSELDLDYRITKAKVESIEEEIETEEGGKEALSKIFEKSNE